MTKAGRDHLKARARRLREDGPRRRFPDLLAEAAHSPLPTPPPAPSTELVLVCNGMAHPIDGGRCARAAGHRNLDGDWGWCGWEPNAAVHVWAGYYNAQSQAQRATEEARRAALTPEERAAEDEEAEAAYWADMAYEGYDPADDDYDRHLEFVLDAQDEERWAAEAEEDEYYAADPYDVAYLEAR
ncbi:hypothetical protein [Streptomyces ipomoeae]|uniref:hypothetical protein n=1 Tax=Streptomyces ipomoeae TaxID=103232 RepID=UPI0015F0A460|nr:hypothetical protein [Streptomyces ipomoeae]